MAEEGALTNEELLKRFHRDYHLYHGITEWRAYTQMRTLHRLAEWVDKPLIECGGKELRDWTRHLMDEGLKPSTVGQYLKTVLALWSWGHGEGLYSAESLLEVRGVRPPRQEADYGRPRPYTQTEIKALRDQIKAAYPRRATKSWQDFARDPDRRLAKVRSELMRYQVEAIMALALYNGLRRAEIYKMTIDDLHPENESLVVKRKGNKLREVPYVQGAREAVERWLAVRSMCDLNHDSPWITIYRAKDWRAPLNQARFNRLFSTIGDGWELHRLRHTCATNWLRSGMRLETVAELLGHEDIQRTRNYARLDTDRVQRSLDSHYKRFTAMIGKEEEEIDGDPAQLAYE